MCLHSELIPRRFSVVRIRRRHGLPQRLTYGYTHDRSGSCKFGLDMADEGY